MSVLEEVLRATVQPGNRAAAAMRLHDRVAESFGAVLRAWSNRDTGEMRPYASRSYLERARRELGALDRRFEVNRIEDVELRNVAVRRPQASARAEPLHAYVEFDARIWLEDLRSGDLLGGDASVSRAFTQRWAFVFKPGRGWVVDSAQSVWTAPAEDAASEEWPGLPPGWYSTRGRPSLWQRWDGSAWIDSRDGVAAR
jgi:predicted lipid-binding transport protein (Tim44 family)